MAFDELITKDSKDLFYFYFLLAIHRIKLHLSFLCAAQATDSEDFYGLKRRFDVEWELETNIQQKSEELMAFNKGYAVAWWKK